MQCKTVQNQLDRFARRELSASGQAAIEAHLEQCDACRQCLAKEERLVAMLRQVPEQPALPEGFEDRLIEAALKRRAATRPGSSPILSGRVGWLRSFVPSSKRAAQATVLACGVLLGIMMGQQTWQAVHPSSMTQTNAAGPHTAYRLDYLSDAPDGSLAESFLALTTTAPSYRGQ